MCFTDGSGCCSSNKTGEVYEYAPYGTKVIENLCDVQNAIAQLHDQLPLYFFYNNNSNSLDVETPDNITRKNNWINGSVSCSPQVRVLHCCIYLVGLACCSLNQLRVICA